MTADKAVSDADVRHRSRKDTKRWCRGHPGVHHLWGPWREWRILGFGFTQRACLDCGKKSPIKQTRKPGE